MAKNPNWTQEEIDYLEKAYDKSSFECMARHLGRSINAIKLKASKLNISGKYMPDGMISLNALAKALTGHRFPYHESWSKCEDMPVYKRHCKGRLVTFIKIEEWWPWAEEHRSLINFANLEPGLLGAEPYWVKLQRGIDQRDRINTKRNEPWTAYDDEKLKALVKQYSHGYREIAERLNRSENAVLARLYKLGLKARPVRRPAHGKWTEEEKQILEHGLLNWYSFSEIAKQLPQHSEKSIRGKVFRLYGSEDLGKARAALLAAPVEFR